MSDGLLSGDHDLNNLVLCQIHQKSKNSENEESDAAGNKNCHAGKGLKRNNLQTWWSFEEEIYMMQQP